MHIERNIRTWVATLLLGLGPAASGGVYTEGSWTSGFASSGNIPDGSTAGWSDTRNVTDIPAGMTIANVSVTINISGGWNGDLYGYLSHNGVLMPLLNRVGMGAGSSSSPTYYFGYGDAGFNNVTLADGAGVNIHNYGGTGVPTGTYAPDSGGLTFGGVFGGGNPNGNWTLFIADLSTGGGLSQVQGWSLEITAVPERVNVALGCFAGVVVVVRLARSRWVRKLLNQTRLAKRGLAG